MSTAGNFREDERHSRLLDWWRERDVRHAAVVHVDFHSDLGDGNSSSKCDSGNFLSAAIAEGRISRIFWIVPATRRVLRDGLARELLQTLPANSLDGSDKCASGRWRGLVFTVPISLHGYDDLPELDEKLNAAEISFDLDFFYHRAMNGPTVNPVEWLTTFCKWRSRIDRAATFLAWSLADGYAPPTYRPVGYWLSQALRNGRVESNSHELWQRVLAAEKCRLGLRRSRDELPKPAIAGSPESMFWSAWSAYTAENWAAFAAALARVAPFMRFRPIEELLVEYQARCVAPAVVRRRVRNALSAGEPCCHGLVEQS